MPLLLSFFNDRIAVFASFPSFFNDRIAVFASFLSFLQRSDGRFSSFPQRSDGRREYDQQRSDGQREKKEGYPPWERRRKRDTPWERYTLLYMPPLLPWEVHPAVYTLPPPPWVYPGVHHHPGCTCTSVHRAGCAGRRCSGLKKVINYGNSGKCWGFREKCDVWYAF